MMMPQEEEEVLGHAGSFPQLFSPVGGVSARARECAHAWVPVCAEF